jgi:ketosteroid isomerase-like protein
MEADECRELDADRVLVLVHYSGRGRTSGLDLGQLRTAGAALFHIRDGKVTKFVRYFDRERAFADLGLAPEAGSAES